jgi:hypothetical protein
MYVKRGWSGETSSNVWQKVDVALDESDLSRLLRENELPDGLAERLPVKVCEALLSHEAEILMLRRLIPLGFPQEEANARVGHLLAGSKAIVKEIKDKLALV